MNSCLKNPTNLLLLIIIILLLLLLLLLLLVLLLLFLLLSGLMLFPGKNTTVVNINQLYQELYFYFFHFISNTFHIILAVPSKQVFRNVSIVSSMSNFSIHFSKCFVTVPNGPITTGITSTFLIFQIFQIPNFILEFTTICPFFFFFLFNSSVKRAYGIYQQAFLTFPIKTVISGSLRSSVLSVFIGTFSQILQSLDSKTFYGLCMYHFPALLNPYFSHSFK